MFPSIYHTLIYNIVIFSSHKKSRIVRRINREYRRLMSTNSINSPVLTYLNKKPFYCPFSHRLLFYQKEFPLYDKQLSKLCLWMGNKLGKKVNIIDVGANVGDTVRNIGIKDAFYLCIEGDTSFSKYIKPNLRGYDYAIEKVFLNDGKNTSGFVVESSNGTGHLKKVDDAINKINLITLDELLEAKYPNIRFDLLKIDTDGFDFKVIRGAQNCLRKWEPLLYFEWDKAYCKEQGEDSLSIFPILDELGYKECILFDNFGNVFNEVATNDTSFLKSSIDNTIGDGLPYYYDVLAIPNNKDYSAKELLSIF